MVHLKLSMFYITVITSQQWGVQKYHDEYVSVGLSVHEDISGTTGTICAKFFVHVAYSSGSVLLRDHWDTLCTSGFVNEIMFLFKNGPYSGMNFATKDQFCLYLIIYRKVGQNSFSIIKGQNYDYFEITRTLK